MQKLLLFTVAFILATLAMAQNVQWHTPTNAGFKNTRGRFEDVFFIDYKTGFAVSLSNEIYKTKDSGQSWSQKSNGSTNVRHRSIEFLDGGEIGIIGTFGNPGRVYRNTDSGETWVSISAAVTDTAAKGGRQLCGLSHSGDNFYGVGWYGAYTGRFYKSTDKGVTWQTSTVDTALASGLVDVAFLSEDTGFVTGTKTHLSGNREAVVLKTTDGGNSWSKVFSDTTIGGIIWKIQFLNRQLAFASIEASPLRFPDTVAIIKSIDGGDQWQMVGVGRKSSIEIGTQGVGFATPLKGWVGGWYDDLFETTDGGVSWHTVNFGRHFNRFFVLDSVNIFAAGPTVYRYGDTTNFPLAVKELAIGPANILYPVTPNPAKGKISIEFKLSKPTNVVLSVINLDTRITYPIANHWHQSGRHGYEWDGSDYPAGLYMVLLENDDHPVTQKFMLVR